MATMPEPTNAPEDLGRADRSLPVGPLSELTCVAGESFLISGVNGDVAPGGDQGLFVRDTRFLDQLELLVDGYPPRPLAGRLTGSSTAAFHGYVAKSDDRAVDPVLLVTRRRVVDGSLHEEIEVENRGREPRDLAVEVRCGTDFAYIFDVKHGRSLERCRAHPTPRGLRFVRAGGDEYTEVAATLPAAAAGDCLRFGLRLEPGELTRLCLDVTVHDVYGQTGPRSRCEAVAAPTSSATRRRGAGRPSIRCSDNRLARLVRRSLEDLRSLELRDPAAPDDRFCAAGSPWFLTLFGRDSMWTAFMALPYDVDLAGGTLRTLARRQGTRVDVDTEMAPGKILHEIRRGALAGRGDLPPNYYGSVDATPLFAILLSEAWRWGLPEADVAALLPNLEAALGWMRDYGDPDGDGFLEYGKLGERGLDNQGWKDSHDGVQFADGRIARAPIALAEVQGYAYDAARRGAELLERFGRPDHEQWRTWASTLADRFRRAFWVSDDLGPYPAIALDRDKAPVDAPASNMGHLLQTGLLDAGEARLVAQRLGHPTLDSGWGLRTMATSAARYNPLSYHGGSVWPHDTAIAVWGLATSGNRDVAADLLQGLVRAGPFFDHRLPELFGGHPFAPNGFPVPYPVACRPQAWSAGAALLLVRACLGAQASVPDASLVLRPMDPPPFRRLELTRLPFAGGELDVRIDAERGLDVDLRGSDVTVEVQQVG